MRARGTGWAQTPRKKRTIRSPRPSIPARAAPGTTAAGSNGSSIAAANRSSWCRSSGARARGRRRPGSRRREWRPPRSLVGEGLAGGVEDRVAGPLSPGRRPVRAIRPCGAAASRRRGRARRPRSRDDAGRRAVAAQLGRVRELAHPVDSVGQRQHVADRLQRAAIWSRGANSPQSRSCGSTTRAGTARPGTRCARTHSRAGPARCRAARRPPRTAGRARSGPRGRARAAPSASALASAGLDQRRQPKASA